MPLLYDAVDHIRLDGTELIKLIDAADLTTSVQTCPGWNLADLAFHVAEAWSFWASIVEGQIGDPNDVRTVTKPERPDDAAIVALMYNQHVRLCDALFNTPADTPVWTWTGANRDVAWVQRRMTHETAMHLWDAATALRFEFDVPPIVAADGIDEFLTWFAAADRREGEMKVGGTVHLHCTDPELTDEDTGEWFIASMKEPAATFTREHRKGDAAIRGRAQDILMWLWRREAEPVEVIGDEVVARRFRAFTDLD